MRPQKHTVRMEKQRAELAALAARMESLQAALAKRERAFLPLCWPLLCGTCSVVCAAFGGSCIGMVLTLHSICAIAWSFALSVPCTSTGESLWMPQVTWKVLPAMALGHAIHEVLAPAVCIWCLCSILFLLALWGYRFLSVALPCHRKQEGQEGQAFQEAPQEAAQKGRSPVLRR